MYYVNKKQCTGGRKRKEPPRFIVLHHTAGEGTPDAVVKGLNGKGFSYHDLVYRGDCYNLYPLERVAYHASHANEGSVGLSVSSRGVAPALARYPREEYHGTAQGKDIRFLKFTEEEIDAVDNRCRELGLLYGIPLVLPDGPLRCLYPTQSSLVGFRGVLGHGHVTTRKVDPSPHLLDELRKRWKCR